MDLLRAKAQVAQGLKNLTSCPPASFDATVAELFGPRVNCHFAHPINELIGVLELVRHFWNPLRTACPDLERHDHIVISGESEGCCWVAATGYYYGTLADEWLGIPATQNWIAIRYGEFYRLESERIVEVYSLIDFIDVMRQAGIHPLPPSLGVESLVQGPTTQDGLAVTPADPEETLKTRRLVDAMIFDGLLQFDGKSSASIGMERYWDPKMMWFGPGGIGTTRGLEGFLKYHQEPFQNAFPDWTGKIPLAVAQGNYMASGGWPSIWCTHNGIPWLGLQPSGRRLSMRVMDWWRREGDWLKENWIFIDIPHIFLQVGVDLFAGLGRRSPR